MHTTAMLGGRSGMWWKFFFFFRRDYFPVKTPSVREETGEGFPQVADRFGLHLVVTKTGAWSW